MFEEKEQLMGRVVSVEGFGLHLYHISDAFGYTRSFDFVDFGLVFHRKYLLCQYATDSKEVKKNMRCLDGLQPQILIVCAVQACHP